MMLDDLTEIDADWMSFSEVEIASCRLCLFMYSEVCLVYSDI
jgi:hypothetical protein